MSERTEFERGARIWSLVDRGQGAWDLLVAPDITIELAKEPNGWTFWGVTIDGERTGGRSIVPPKLAETFDLMARAASRLTA